MPVHTVFASIYKINYQWQYLSTYFFRNSTSIILNSEYGSGESDKMAEDDKRLSGPRTRGGKSQAANSVGKKILLQPSDSIFFSWFRNQEPIVGKTECLFVLS